MPQIIKFDHVFFSYSQENPDGIKWAIRDIDLSIKQGEFLAVMGENGAGKSTFCKLVNGIIPHLHDGQLLGTVFVDGEDTGKISIPQLALKAGMVFDDPDAQLFTATVRHEAAFGPENLLLPAREIEERVDFALKAVGLCGFEDRSVPTLSGGEKQRLAIASILTMAGKILVLDEPLACLDPQGAAQVLSVLKDIREKYQLTVIMATNNGNEAKLADRVCVLKNGSVIAYDTADTVLANHIMLEENGIQPPLEKIDIHAAFPVRCDESTDGKTENPAIEITGLSFSYGVDMCLENLDLTVADNDFLAITGRNGCGKTTLLKIITGLLRPSNGDVFVRGKNTKQFSVSAISKEIGFVMQNPSSQLFTDSVFNEIAFALKNAGSASGKNLSKAEIQKQVEQALRITGLEDPDAFPHALNRADRTKVVLASVLAMGCKIIIFDEIDIGQDYRGSRRLMNIARDLHARGYTIIFVTHNIHLACKYAHRMIMMDKGIVFDGKKKN